MAAQDVDLDDLYNAPVIEDAPEQPDNEGAELEPVIDDNLHKLPYEELLQQLRSQLESLHSKVAAATKVPDYVDIAAKAKALCTAARRRAEQRITDQQTSIILDAAAKAAAEGKDPLQAKVAAAGQALAHQRLTNDGLTALLPAADDGTTCLLLYVPPAHSTARLTAFVGRYGPEPAKVYKEEGRGFALLVFSNAEQRSSFAQGFRSQARDTAASSDMLLLLPGDEFPEGAAQILCGKRRREAPQERKPGRQRQEQKHGGGAGGVPDIRSVVCPWWDRPYQQQLQAKMDTVMGCLRQLTQEVEKTYIIPHPKPAWLEAALHSPNKTAVLLPGIIRSPQVDGYRNKAEFSVGLDADERPIVGFLQGNFVDGHTQVVDPSGCPHMSPTSLAYAAAFTDFLRSPECTLPPWDKRNGTGFWRLLLVREGLEASFLPLPAVAPSGQQQQQQPAAGGDVDMAELPEADAAAADGSSSRDQQQQQQQQRVRHQRLGVAPDPPVLPPVALSQLPVERWLVANPLAQPPGAAPLSGAGMPLTEVYEGESKPPPSPQVMVMVQINPLAAPQGPPQIKQQLNALEAALKATATAQALALTSLAVQYHSGVANAAPPTAPFTPFGVMGPVVRAGGASSEAAAAAAGGSSEGGSGVLGIMDALCELRFRVSPTAFYQVNAGGTCLLYHVIGKMAGVGPDSLLLDVCCGTGTIGLTLAQQVAAVVGIDNVQSAIDDAHTNAMLNGISNTTFVCGAAEKVIESVLQEHAPKYSHVVAVVDPPRAGLHKDVLFALLTCPAIKRLVYVSCNPDSLVHNAKILCGRWRPDLNAAKSDNRKAKRPRQDTRAPPPLPKYEPFRPTQVMAFDLFPHTAHVEAVVLFERE